MKAPDKIYVEVRHPFGNEFTEMLGFESRGNSDDIEYICKDTFLEWLEAKVYEHNEDKFDDGFNTALGQVIDKINSL